MVSPGEELPEKLGGGTHVISSLVQTNVKSNVYMLLLGRMASSEKQI